MNIIFLGSFHHLLTFSKYEFFVSCLLVSQYIMLISLLLSSLIVYPPPPAKGGLGVTKEDLKCLEYGEFLNDVIIDFYLK